MIYSMKHDFVNISHGFDYPLLPISDIEQSTINNVVNFVMSDNSDTLFRLEHDDTKKIVLFHTVEIDSKYFSVVYNAYVMNTTLYYYVVTVKELTEDEFLEKWVIEQQRKILN